LAALFRGGGERLHFRRLGSGAIRMLVRDVGLVVDALGVHFPDVVVRAGEQVVDRAHRRQHRVVGVVVAMQPVAADLLQVLDPVEPAPNRRNAFRVVGVVDRVGLRDADREPALHLRPRREPQLLELARGKLDESVVAHRPEVVALETEVLEPDARLVGIRDHPG